MNNHQTTRVKMFLKEFTLIPVIVLLVIICSVLNSTFLTAFNISGVLQETAFMAFLAFGITFVILTGGIDLSVGGVAGISTVIVALVMKKLYVGNDAVTILLALFLSFAVCLALGAFNGFCVTVFKLPPLIVTLSTTWIAKGIGNTLIKGAPMALAVKSYKAFLGKKLFGWIPITILIAAAVLIILIFVFSSCRWGREIYAVGSNDYAAHLSGIKTKRVLMRAYIFSAVFSCIAGWLIASYTGSGYPDAANNYETYSIAAAVMGGISMNGGEGKIYQAFLGVIVLRLINKFVVFSGLSSISGFIEGIIMGTILIGVLLLNNARKER